MKIDNSNKKHHDTSALDGREIHNNKNILNSFHISIKLFFSVRREGKIEFKFFYLFIWVHSAQKKESSRNGTLIEL